MPFLQFLGTSVFISRYASGDSGTLCAGFGIGLPWDVPWGSFAYASARDMFWNIGGYHVGIFSSKGRHIFHGYCVRSGCDIGRNSFCSVSFVNVCD